MKTTTSSLLLVWLLMAMGLGFTQCQQGKAGKTSGGAAAAASANFAPSDADPDGRKSAAIVDRVTKTMGGRQAWDQVRYVAWSFNGSYQIWDKHANTYRYEKDSVVAITSLDTRQGKAYIHGRDVTGTPAGQEIIGRMYPSWANNSYWLIMPFKLTDQGLTVRYVGEGQTEAGEAADFLELTFQQVGVTPQNKYVIGVSKEKGLVTQWAFYRNATDPDPSFTRPWYNYQSYGPVMLSTGRHPDPEAGINIRHLAIANSLPASDFNRPTPIEKL